MDRGRTITVAVLVVGLFVGAIGHGLLTAGLHRVGSPDAPSPRAVAALLGRAAVEPLVLLGLVLLLFFFVCYLFALSRADLSFVLPITALDFLISAVIIAPFLGEHVSRARWLGIGLIALGVLVVARTRPASAPRAPAADRLPS